MKKLLTILIILAVIAGIGYQTGSSILTDSRLLTQVETMYQDASLPIIINDNLQGKMLANFHYDYRTNGINNYYDPASLGVDVKSSARNNAYVLAHEFGHFVGILYLNNNTEEFADSYAKYYLEGTMSPSDAWVVSAYMLLNNRDYYTRESFDQLMAAADQNQVMMMASSPDMMTENITVEQGYVETVLPTEQGVENTSTDELIINSEADLSEVPEGEIMGD